MASDADDPELKRLALLFDGKGFESKDREWAVIGRLQRAGLVRVQTTSRTTATVWAKYQPGGLAFPHSDG